MRESTPLQQAHAEQSAPGDVSSEMEVDTEDEQSNSRPRIIGGYQCIECKEGLDTFALFCAHEVDRHADVTHHCEQCNKTFTPLSRWSAHLRRDHPESWRVACPANGCNGSFKTWPRLYQHCRSRHQERVPEAPRFSCYLCEKSFPTRSSRKRHLNMHGVTTGEKWRCSRRCALKSMAKRDVQRHIHRKHRDDLNRGEIIVPEQVLEDN